MDGQEVWNERVTRELNQIHHMLEELSKDLPRRMSEDKDTLRRERKEDVKDLYDAIDSIKSELSRLERELGETKVKSSLLGFGGGSLISIIVKLLGG